MDELVIIGAGGLGKEVAYIVEEINKKNLTYKLLGFIDDAKDKLGENIIGYSVIGGIDYLKKIKYSGKIIIAIADCRIKKMIVNKILALNLDIEFPIIKHPSLEMHDSVKVGAGSILYASSIISPDVIIGEHVIISPKCGIGHDTVIGSFSSILWNVSIAGNDIIDKSVFVGSAATIIQGKKVVSDSLIGAGAVVVKDILEAGIYIGIPARKG